MEKYAQDLKLVMSEKADFKPEFEQVFNGYMNEDLRTPKNEVLIKIEAQLAQKKEKTIAKRDDNLNILDNPKVLPQVNDSADKIDKKLRKHRAENLIEIMKKDDEKVRQLYGIDVENTKTNKKPPEFLALE